MGNDWRHLNCTYSSFLFGLWSPGVWVFIKAESPIRHRRVPKVYLLTGNPPNVGAVGTPSVAGATASTLLVPDRR